MYITVHRKEPITLQSPGQAKGRHPLPPASASHSSLLHSSAPPALPVTHLSPVANATPSSPHHTTTRRRSPATTGSLIHPELIADDTPPKTY
jgi:hypothetical protein